MKRKRIDLNIFSWKRLARVHSKGTKPRVNNCLISSTVYAQLEIWIPLPIVLSTIVFSYACPGSYYTLDVNPFTIMRYYCIDFPEYTVRHLAGNPETMFHHLRKHSPWLLHMIRNKQSSLLTAARHLKHATRDLVALCRKLNLCWIPQLYNESTMSFADIWFRDPPSPFWLMKQDFEKDGCFSKEHPKK